MKLAMIRTMANHTSGDAKPLIPVQEKALSGCATSIAPRFKRSSETNTQRTLKPRCSHGLPKPEGRFCNSLFPAVFVMSSEVETSLIVLRLAGEAKTRGQRFLHFRRNANNRAREYMALRSLKLIRIRKPLQDRFMPGRPEILQHATEYRIQQGAG